MAVCTVASSIWGFSGMKLYRDLRIRQQGAWDRGCGIREGLGEGTGLTASPSQADGDCFGGRGETRSSGRREGRLVAALTGWS
ncbi:MAG: hypothetical protein OXH99_10155 [Bryobacterales bacterium]|nr:hypothetical protein [Bryobacterales bacterium]